MRSSFTCGFGCALPPDADGVIVAGACHCDCCWSDVLPTLGPLGAKLSLICGICGGGAVCCGGGLAMTGGGLPAAGAPPLITVGPPLGYGIGAPTVVVQHVVRGSK